MSTLLERAEFKPGGMLRIEADRPMVNGVLVFHYDPKLSGYRNATNIDQHVNSFARHSRFRVWNVNTDLPMSPALAEYDFRAIVIHWSLFGAKPGVSPLLGSPFYLLDEGHREFIRTSAAHKIGFFQDEHTYCQARFGFCNEFELDTVYTCLLPSEYEKTWGRYTKVPNVKTTIPGFVDDGLVEIGERFGKPDSERTVDVGYRARPMPIFMDTAQEKTEVGFRFLELTGDAGLALDVDLSEEGRLYRDDWWRFIANCRAMLGVESGVSLFDSEDRVRADFARLAEQKGGEGEVTLEDLQRGSLPEWDNKVYYRTISPRHFEAASLRVPQILFEGAYSEAMEPGTHYIPLAKDFSNLDEVIRSFRDPTQRNDVAERAHRDLIASGDFGYEAFIAGFDEHLVQMGLDPGVPRELALEVDRAARRGRFVRAARVRARRELDLVVGRVLRLYERVATAIGRVLRRSPS